MVDPWLTRGRPVIDPWLPRGRPVIDPWLPRGCHGDHRFYTRGVAKRRNGHGGNGENPVQTPVDHRVLQETGSAPNETNGRCGRGSDNKTRANPRGNLHVTGNRGEPKRDIREGLDGNMTTRPGQTPVEICVLQETGGQPGRNNEDVLTQI